MAELRRLVRRFGAWVEATPRGLFERISEKRSVQAERAERLVKRLESLDLKIEAVRRQRLAEENHEQR